MTHKDLALNIARIRSDNSISTLQTYMSCSVWYRDGRFEVRRSGSDRYVGVFDTPSAAAHAVLEQESCGGAR